MYTQRNKGRPSLGGGVAFYLFVSFILFLFSFSLFVEETLVLPRQT